MTEKGRFIVIEGADGSGKATQLKLLADKLNSLNKKVLLADFPRYYDSPWGELVGDFLSGKFGKFENVDPHLVVLTYMIDEYTWSRDIGRPWKNNGGMILSNRYFTSNVHQIAKLKTIAKKMYRNWLWRMGYKELGILKPDLVVFLDVPWQIGRKLIKKKKARLYLKGRKKDLAEIDIEHQKSAYQEYLYTVNHHREWIKIRCMSGGELDTPEVIHKRVWKLIDRRFKLSSSPPLLSS
ncbi:hypothetical protein A2V80_02565 [Candidatus Woesebacteria bacterium RBG_16_39_8b]|uniref:Thymidylate kinase-like domain-containing protein n=1 Tax=Candidatus Woesebacteria bacterium RBG_16_39_8b TaxID=1802482 RepID=A0A1F7X845_9BACT|nr:MAG: hypothetical protein A2V80_02565 [Candidatus Woesebacteria bacterium RBG_16_39_8b]